jgi:hypothetical protein
MIIHWLAPPCACIVLIAEHVLRNLTECKLNHTTLVETVV